MSAPHPHTLSKFFSSLLGRDVSFSLASKSIPTKTTQMLGEYRVEPDGGACVVSADLAMLAQFAAALLGLPGEVASARSLHEPMDEPIRDAIHEVLNVAASGIATTHRLVFRHMYRDAVYLSSQAADTFAQPLSTSAFDVKLDGAEIGRFVIYSV